MIMKRRAIFMGDNDASHGLLAGVSKDLNDVYGFLCSDRGGAWESTEFLYLPRPNTVSLKAALLDARAAALDYLLIMFAGHGGHDATHGSYVCLSSNEDYLASGLRGMATRQFILIDACRTLSRVSLREDSIKLGRERPAGALDPSYRQRCRRAYDAAVQQAEEGTVTVLSCSVNQSAGDTANGGVFTQALLGAASRWIDAGASSFSTIDVLGLSTVFSEATAKTRQLNHPQLPVIEQGRRRLSFPFAVR